MERPAPKARSPITFDPNDRERDSCPRTPKPAQKRIDQFFSGPGARADDWRDLVEAAKALGPRRRSRELRRGAGQPVGDGRIPRLSRPAIDGGPAGSSLGRRCGRVACRLRPGSRRPWRRDPSASMPATGVRRTMAMEMRPTWCRRHSARIAARRPYFETLIVTGVSSSQWPALSAEWRKLRRPVDGFIYEPVIVGKSRRRLLRDDAQSQPRGGHYQRGLCAALASRRAGAAFDDGLGRPQGRIRCIRAAARPDHQAGPARA